MSIYMSSGIARVKTKVISTNRPGHCTTHVSDLGPTLKKKYSILLGPSTINILLPGIPLQKKFQETNYASELNLWHFGFLIKTTYFHRCL